LHWSIHAAACREELLGRLSWPGTCAFATIDDDDLHSVVIEKKT
jgi:hypothetical protein